MADGPAWRVAGGLGRGGDGFGHEVVALRWVQAEAAICQAGQDSDEEGLSGLAGVTDETVIEEECRASLGSHDDAKGKVKGAEGKDGQHTKRYGPLATQPFHSARVESEPYREVPATPKVETLTREDSTP